MGAARAVWKAQRQLRPRLAGGQHMRVQSRQRSGLCGKVWTGRGGLHQHCLHEGGHAVCVVGRSLIPCSAAVCHSSFRQPLTRNEDVGDASSPDLISHTRLDLFHSCDCALPGFGLYTNELRRLVLVAGAVVC